MTTEGFVKASLNNLPCVHIFMVTEFIKNDHRFCSAKFKGIKAAAASKETYGDNAIRYVEVKREENICTVQGKICPKHRVKSKTYSVSLLVDEEAEKIVDIVCKDCAASAGSCRHALAFLMWVNWQNEDPASTEVQSYWQKPKLSGVKTTTKFIKAEEFWTSQISSSSKLDNSNFLQEVINIGREKNCGGQLILYNCLDNLTIHCDNLSIYKLLVQFMESDGSTAEDFFLFAKNKINIDKCKKAKKQTREQVKSPLWHELRYGHVTASKLYEKAKCKTAEEVLVENIIGAYKIKDTIYMKRRRDLEKKVKEAVEKKLKIKIKNCGLFLLPDYPIFGASPNGITNDHIIDIKCPSSSKTLLNYIRNGQIRNKCKVQIHLQMFFANKQAGFFCVADPDFENNSNVNIFTIDFDFEFLKVFIDDTLKNWTDFIFSKLYNYKMFININFIDAFGNSLRKTLVL